MRLRRRVLLHSFDRFISDYQSSFEKEYDIFSPIVKEVVIRIINHLKLKNELAFSPKYLGKIIYEDKFALTFFSYQIKWSYD